jgi:hypothetical protein
MRAQRQWKIVAERRDQTAEQRQDQDPQQHRAFVVSPHPGNFVDQGLQRMRILIHVHDGKIRRHVQRDQRTERRERKSHLGECGRARDIHQRRIAQARTEDRYRGLDQRQPEREHQGVVACLSDHFAAPCMFAGLAP